MNIRFSVLAAVLLLAVLFLGVNMFSINAFRGIKLDASEGKIYTLSKGSRNIVGALVYVGKGTHPPAWVGEVLAGRDRARAAPTFEACGLYFAGVDYDPVWQLKVERSGIHSDGAGDTALVLP